VIFVTSVKIELFHTIEWFFKKLLQESSSEIHLPCYFCFIH